MANPAACDLVLGIDLGGTNAQVGLVDTHGRIVDRLHLPTNAGDGWNTTVARMAHAVHSVCDAAGVKTAAIRALGIGAPGTIDGDAGVVAEAPNLRWNDVPLARALQDQLGGITVALDNDVNAALAGEAAFGAARNERDVLAVWIGTGIGGGILLQGNLVRGPLGSAGEIGRTLLLSTNPIGMQHLEDICSRAAVTRRLQQLARSNHPTALRDALMACTDPLTFPARAIADAYAAGDALTRLVIDETADFLGRGIASACTLLGTPIVILGGGLSEALGQHFVELVSASCNQHVLPRLQGRVQCRLTSLGADAGIVGAACIARDSLR